MNLNHIAIIPDGNRRWAKAKGLDSADGHRKGMENFEVISKAAKQKGIKYLTAWGLSKDNIEKRTVSEIKFLYNLFGEYFDKLLSGNDIHKDKIKVRVIGEWGKYFPSPVKRLARKLEQATQLYKNYNLTLLLAYDGKREMQDAFRKGSGKNLRNYLWTRELPPVDLVIRTGEERNLAHWSAGFLMWHTADSEFYFTRTAWPEFGAKEFNKALLEYEKRPRNLGR